MIAFDSCWSGHRRSWKVDPFAGAEVDGCKHASIARARRNCIAIVSAEEADEKADELVASRSHFGAILGPGEYSAQPLT